VYLIPCSAEEAVALFDLTVTHLPLQIVLKNLDEVVKFEWTKIVFFDFVPLLLLQ